MSTRNLQGGWGLVETLLTLGALSVLSTAIYIVLGPTSATAQTKREQDNLRDLSLAVESSFGLTGHFSTVSASSVVRDGLAPGRMMDGTRLRTAWGTGVDLAPVSIRAPNDGFSIVYPLAPASVCAKLAAAVARDVYDLRIDGSSVMDSGRLDVNATAALCSGSDAATMEFVYHSGLVAGGLVAAPPLSLPPSPPGVAPPAVVPLDITVGPVSPTGPATPGTPVAPTAPPPGPPPPAAPPPSVGPPASPTAPPAGPPVGPPPELSPCAVPPVETRNVACPAGQAGTHMQQRSGYCSTSPSGPYEAWETPRMTGWTTTSNTCAPSYVQTSPYLDCRFVGSVAPSGTQEYVNSGGAYPACSWSGPLPGGLPSSNLRWVFTVKDPPPDAVSFTWDVRAVSGAITLQTFACSGPTCVAQSNINWDGWQDENDVRATVVVTTSSGATYTWTQRGYVYLYEN